MSDGQDRLLAEQIAYYRAATPEYFDHAIDEAAGGAELEAALDAFRPAGDVLELAWRIAVRPTSGPFFWGSGTRA